MIAQHETTKRRPPHPIYLPDHLPRVNFEGAVVGGRFRVQRLKLQGEYLDIYSVTDLFQGNRTVEAQAVPLACPMGKLQKSRVRRLKRIYRSHNFQCSFNLDGRKFVISHVARSEAEWANLVADSERHVDDGESDADNDFPALPSVRLLASREIPGRWLR